MQKKLIALAIAGFAAAPAFAQVTIYGVADAYVGAFKTDAANGESSTRTAVNGGLLSGPRLGFKGEEDLGNGLKAVFVFEAAVNLDDGSASLFGRSRQGYVGVTSAQFGRISLGQQYAAGYFAPGNSDGFASAQVGPQSILSQMGDGTNAMTITPNSPARISNSINWVSPAFGPVTVNALYGFGEDNDNPLDAEPNEGKANNFLALGGTFKMGPVVVDGVYHKKQLTDTTRQTEGFIGGAYDLGVVKLGASYQEMSRAQRDTKLILVSGIVPVGVGNIHVAYGTLDRDDLNDDKVKSFSLAYTHALSKRTTAYAGLNRTTIGDLAVGNPFTTVSTVGIATVRAGGTAQLVAAGLRHTF